MSIIVTLDSVVKHRSTKEYRRINRAISGQLEVVGDGCIIKQLLATILDSEPTRKDDLVYVYRGDTLCFNPITLQDWFKKKEQPPQLKKVRTTS